MSEKQLKIINIILIIILILLLPIPRYKVSTPGRGSLISEAYDYTSTKEQSIYVPYVLTKGATLGYYIRSKFDDRIDLFQYKESFFRDDEYEIVSEIGRNMVNETYYRALRWLLDYEGIEYSIDNENFTIAFVSEESNFELKEEDVIKKVNDRIINNFDDFYEAIGDIDDEEEFNITVLRDEKEVEITGKRYYDDEREQYLVGIIGSEYYEINTDVGFEINEQRRVSGSSGGLATALSMYYTYTQEELFINIYATGEITKDGDVLKVGGIKHKLIGGDNNADLFILPYENKEESEKVVEDFSIQTEIIYVSSIIEAIDKLNLKMK